MPVGNDWFSAVRLCHKSPVFHGAVTVYTVLTVVSAVSPVYKMWKLCNFSQLADFVLKTGGDLRGRGFRVKAHWRADFYFYLVRRGGSFSRLFQFE